MRTASQQSFRLKDALLQVFYLAGFLVVAGGFMLHLSQFDLSQAQQPDASSALSQAVLGSIYVIAALIMIRAPIFPQIIVRAWPVFLLPLLALLSALWAPDPMLTLRRALAFSGTIIFGLSLATAFDVRDCLRVVLRALALAVVLSVIWALVFPRYGVHQTTDAVGIAEAGAWRGIFNGKNALGGLIAGPAFAFLLVYGRHAFETWTLRGLALAASLACLLMARSGAGYIVAGILAIMGSFLSLAAAQPIKVRISMLALAAGVALIPVAFGEDLAGMVLELLNRDASLSGRTTIWTYVLQLMEGHWTLGYGYYSGFVLLGAKMDEANPGLNFGSTHSGYLDLLVSFGVVGVCVGVGYLLWLSVIAFGKFMSWKTAIANPAITFSLCVIAFAALNNIVESTILAPNCIVPMLLSISAGMLSRETIIESAASARNQLNDPRIQGQLTKPALGRGVGH